MIARVGFEPTAYSLPYKCPYKLSYLAKNKQLWQSHDLQDQIIRSLRVITKLFSSFQIPLPSYYPYLLYFDSTFNFQFI